MKKVSFLNYPIDKTKKKNIARLLDEMPIKSERKCHIHLTSGFKKAQPTGTSI